MFECPIIQCSLNHCYWLWHASRSPSLCNPGQGRAELNDMEWCYYLKMPLQRLKKLILLILAAHAFPHKKFGKNWQ